MTIWRATERDSPKRWLSETVSTVNGPVTITVPRDRNSEVEPQIAPRRPRPVGQIDELVLFCHARGVSRQQPRIEVTGEPSTWEAGHIMELHRADILVAAALAGAEREGIAVTVAVVDTGGHLVALSRMEGAGFLTVDIATGKAFTAAAACQPSGGFGEALAGWPDFTATLREATHGKLTLGPGGYPVVVDGALIGAVAVSGGAPSQDDWLAKDTAAALS